MPQRIDARFPPLPQERSLGEIALDFGRDALGLVATAIVTGCAVAAMVVAAALLASH